MIDGSQPVEKYALPVSKDELAKKVQEYSKIPVELTRNKEQQQEPISGEPAYPPPRLNPATRASKTYGNQLESPILLPALQQVEPSPSTSLLASYPLPLCPTGPRTYNSSGEDCGAMYSWAYPKNCIAPSRNRQAMARAAMKSVGEKDRPKREGAANDDGYNWRKYGEKQVKGSPYPRSYYKCSYPGCPVKKIVERDPKTGRVSEAAVKGSHNHAKPGTTRGSGGAVRARELEDSPRVHNAYNQIVNESVSGDHDTVHEDDQVEDAGPSKLPEETNNESAAAALQLLGTGFSPAVQGPLTAHAHYQDTPSSFLPIPASLRNGSIEPEDYQERNANSNYQAVRQPSQHVVINRRKQPYQRSLITVAKSDNSEEEYDSEAMDSGEDDDAWEASQTAHRCEPASTAAAAMLAANAAAYAAAEEARKESIGQGGISVMVGKRKRKPRRDEDYVDPNVEGEEDEELKVMRNMGKGYPKTAMVDASIQAQKRRAFGATPSPEGNTVSGCKKRPPEQIDSSLGNELVTDERNVVEMETDADNMDDGFRWRKYGQKQVKGNAFPRSYYKCTHPGCNVRKQVERSGRNARLLSTTYEGTHNHEAPSSFGLRTLPRRTAPGSNKSGYSAAKAPQPDGAQGLVTFSSAGGLQQVPVILTQSSIGTVQLTLPGGLQVGLQPGLQTNQLAATLSANCQLEIACSAGLGVAGLRQLHQILQHPREDIQGAAVGRAAQSSVSTGITASAPLGIMLPPGFQFLQSGQQMIAPSMLPSLQKMLAVVPNTAGLQMNMCMQPNVRQTGTNLQQTEASVQLQSPNIGSDGASALQQAPNQQTPALSHHAVPDVGVRSLADNSGMCAVDKLAATDRKLESLVQL